MKHEKTTTQQRNNATTHKIRRFYGLLFLLMLSVGMKGYAQAPFGSASFKNCYQSFTWGVAQSDTLKVRLLDAPGGRYLTFSVKVNPLDISGYQIIYFDDQGNPIVYSQIPANGIFHVPDSVPVIQINPINNTGGWAGYYPAVGTFIAPEDAFDIFPAEDSCFTFNNFNFSSALNLDGFCGSVDYGLKTLAGMGFGPAFINPNMPYILDNTDYCNPSWIEPCELPPPCPRCTEFILQLTVHPCQGMELDPDCPPLVINKPIEICCFCGPQEYER